MAQQIEHRPPRKDRAFSRAAREPGNESRLRIAANAASLGIFEIDGGTFEIVWANEHMYEMFDLSPSSGPRGLKEILVNHLDREDSFHLSETLERAIKRGGKVHFVAELNRGGKSKRWLQVSGQVYDHDGVAKRLLVAVSDITDQKHLRARTTRLTLKIEEVQQAERRNVFQELHDTTVQHLVGASLMVSELRRKDSATQLAALDALEGSLAIAIKEIRTLSYLMHPASITPLRFAQATSNYVQGFSKRSGLECNFRCDRPPVEYSSDALHAAFRVIQEGLTNIFRHARSSKASVQIRVINECLHVVVSDTGRGFGAFNRHKTSLPSFAGSGLKGMRLRVRQMRGRLSLSSSHEGVRIHAIFPVPPMTALPRRLTSPERSVR